MVMKTLDHVTTIVKSFDETTAALARVLQVRPVLEWRIPGIVVGTFTIGGAELHIVTPRGDGPVADLVAKGHDGLHHVALRVEDLARTLDELRARGIRTLGEPVEALPGIREVFLDPTQTGGLLIQAVERK
jgi:catechol 2,3-dioxygenase-like lactoylglutathione lyase family enzyme